MSKKQTSDSTVKIVRGPRFKGKFTPVALVIAVKAALTAAALFAVYLVALFAAVRMVPLTMGFVKDGSGVRMDMPFETVIAVWIAPSVFLLALLFALVLLLIRTIWRARTRVIARFQGWVLGEAPEGVEGQATPPLGVAKRR